MQLSQVNFAIFKSTAIECTVSSTSVKHSMVKNCTCLTRVSEAMKYYDIYCGNTTQQNNSIQNNFLQFCDEVYSNMLEDYIHIIKIHNMDVHKIAYELTTHYGFTNCVAKKCAKISRHYRREAPMNTGDLKQDDRLGFYYNLYDQLHYFIFHLYDIGLRINQKELSNIIDQKTVVDPQNNSDVSCIDGIFKQKLQLIRSRRKQHGMHLERFNDENNKFNINIKDFNDNLTVSQTQESVFETKETTTFTEELYKHLEHNTVVSKEKLKVLMQFVEDNEYDTDAIQFDLSGFQTKEYLTGAAQISNIFKHGVHVTSILSMKRFIRNVKLSEASFSTGFVFFYWDYFIDKTEKQIGDWLNGHSAADLYVSPIYDSLKQEILASGFIGITEWMKKVVNKAANYCKASKCRKLKCTTGYYSENNHNIKYKTPISISHVQAIILYCDWSQLCTDFSSTFRKNNYFEPLESLKLRHSRYYWFSKFLVEAVNDFGTNGQYAPQIGETGPFYCGMSWVMNIPSFAIYLKGPCSTSKDVEIAINFAKRDGIIIQLQNDQFNEGAEQRFFDCSWISTYAEENERIFISGGHRLRIESITIIETAENFGTFFHSLYIFDSMISAVDVGAIAISSSDTSILETAIKKRLDKTSYYSNEYIDNVFDSFLSKKTQIKINIHYLSAYFKELSHLIVHDVENKTTGYNANEKLMNVLNVETLSIFPNLNQVIIETTSYNYDTSTYNEYKCNLLVLLSSIQSSRSTIMYIIKGSGYPTTWLEEIFSSSIQDTFRNSKWDIKLYEYKKYDSLVIKKM
eukprot:445202_1